MARTGWQGPRFRASIDLETMLSLTADAEVDGTRFDGVDLFLSAPHTDIDSTDEDLARLAESLSRRNLRAGSLVAPVWPEQAAVPPWGVRMSAGGS